MTLLLGPPNSGKITLLLALVGHLGYGLKIDNPSFMSVQPHGLAMVPEHHQVYIGDSGHRIKTCYGFKRMIKERGSINGYVALSTISWSLSKLPWCIELGLSNHFDFNYSYAHGVLVKRQMDFLNSIMCLPVISLVLL